jgi:hypothetical protein
VPIASWADVAAYAGSPTLTGWRLDSFVLSKRIADLAKFCEIRHEWCVLSANMAQAAPIDPAPCPTITAMAHRITSRLFSTSRAPCDKLDLAAAALSSSTLCLAPLFDSSRQGTLDCCCTALGQTMLIH